MPTLTTYALKHLSSSKNCPLKNKSVVKDKRKTMSQNDCHSPCSQKRQSQPLRHKPAVNPRVTKDSGYTPCVTKGGGCTPRVTEDDGHTTCHNDNGIHHVSQKTTVHTTCHKRLWYTPRVTKDDGTHHV